MNDETVKVFALGIIFAYGIYNPAQVPLFQALSILSLVLAYQKATIGSWLFHFREYSHSLPFANENSVSLAPIALFICLETLLSHLLQPKIPALFLKATYKLGAVLSVASLLLIFTSLHILSATNIKRCVFIDHGIYVYLRHPYYLGVVLLFAGCNLLAGNILSVALIAVVAREKVQDFIKKEEELLISRNKNYIKYMDNVWSGIPLGKKALPT